MRSSLALCLLVQLGAAAWLPQQPQLRVSAPRSHSRASVCASATVEDELIKELRGAAPKEFTNILANNLNRVDQKIFLRLAELADAAKDDDERDEIARLSSSVASTIETLLVQASKAADADADAVQALMRTAANSDGEFDVPLQPEQAAAVRAEVLAKLGELDEGFVGTIEAYMKKANDDGLEGLVEMLRELLQIFATERMLKMLEGPSTPTEVLPVLRATLEAPPADWEAQLRELLLAEGAEASPEMLLSALQDKMGEVVLGMPSGSKVQGVLAEMLNELITRARVIEAEAA